MNTMRCEQCGRFVDGKPCPFCQSTRVRPLREGETPTSPLEAPPAGPAAGPAPVPETPAPPRPRIVPPLPAAKAEEKRAEPVRAPQAAEEKRPEPPRPVKVPEERRVEPPRGTGLTLPPREDALADQQQPSRDRIRPVSPPAVEPTTPSRFSRIRNLEEFETLLTAEGFEALVICGQGNSGKSEIAGGFTRANSVFRRRAMVGTLQTRSGVPYLLAGTAPGEVWYQPLNTRRKLVFLDPSGEFFKNISPSERKRLRLPDVSPEYFDFVRVAVQRLAGVVLVVDLTNTLDDMAEAPWQNQEHDLAYTLAALRWLRRDRKAAVEQLGVSSLIASRLQSLRRLDVPVLVLFSKADKLGELTNETPYSFAQSRLPDLFSAVLSHARHFRFDFVSTMTHDDKRDVDRQSPRPCGALLPMEWLIGGPFRWLPSLPTRWLGGGS